MVKLATATFTCSAQLARGSLTTSSSHYTVKMRPEVNIVVFGVWLYISAVDFYVMYCACLYAICNY